MNHSQKRFIADCAHAMASVFEKEGWTWSSPEKNIGTHVPKAAEIALTIADLWEGGSSGRILVEIDQDSGLHEVYLHVGSE